jgi:hypothetical protein
VYMQHVQDISTPVGIKARQTVSTATYGRARSTPKARLFSNPKKKDIILPKRHACVQSSRIKTS